MELSKLHIKQVFLQTPKIDIEHVSRVNTACTDLHSISKEQRAPEHPGANEQGSPTGSAEYRPGAVAQKQPNPPPAQEQGRS